MNLEIVAVTEKTAELWREIHNRIIATDPLSSAEVLDRISRYQLTLAYADGVAVGNGTLRPPAEDSPAVTVIVRVLPEFRGRGYGIRYAAWSLVQAGRLGSDRLETVIAASNEAGLRFAQRLGFTELDRYVLDETGVEWVDLWMDASPGRP